jgi:hypothetical protein
MVTSTTEWDYGYAGTQEARMWWPVTVTAIGEGIAGVGFVWGVKRLLV